MAEISNEQQGAEKGKHKKVRSKKSSTHIDMTPMVDLAFLLLTFFMLSTTFSKPKTMEINMPVKQPENTDTLKITNAITLLLTDKNKIFWYFGEFKPEETQLDETSFSPDASNSLRKILLDKNKSANDRIRDLEKKLIRGEIKDTTFKRMRVDIQAEKQSLFVLIKTDDKAKYKNVIDALDECNITNVGKYALVDIMQAELDMLLAKTQ
ncbi:MAG TPA: biopolymer transporter ExbD [Bacteroidia bacterium]|nr:biopolymer transporter ExbD [Bacteroidia bacterium]